MIEFAIPSPIGSGKPGFTYTEFGISKKVISRAQNTALHHVIPFPSAASMPG